MEGGRAGRALFKGVKFQLAGFDAAEKFKFNDLLGSNGAEEAPFEECTHVIVSGLQYDDPVCAAARRDGKALVTKAWVTVSLGANALMDTSSVLYMPIRDPSGIPGCKSFCICLTGYQGQARREIMEMVEMMGSKFTKQLNMQLVTHLICYKFEGPKYEAAKRCKIKLVNHRWLEDCLRQWCLMDELNYTTMSGYEIEELESQLNDSQDAEPADRTPVLDVELQVTKPSTKHAKDTGLCSIADHTGGDKNVASKLRKQTVVKGTTPRVNGRHGNRAFWEDMECVVEEVRASELTKQAALVRPGTKSNEVELQAQKQVATTFGTEARQSPVNSDKNHVKELQGKQFAATEVSGRQKDGCIEPSRQQQVAGDSKRAEPFVGAVKDNGAGSCSFERHADTAFERRRKTLSKDKVPRSCSPKDQSRIRASPTEASGREKHCCIEPIRQQHAEPAIGAVKDSGAGSCSFIREASPDADSAFERKRKTLSKDKVPRSCSTKDQFRIPDKPPTQRASPTMVDGVQPQWMQVMERRLEEHERRWRQELEEVRRESLEVPLRRLNAVEASLRRLKTGCDVAMPNLEKEVEVIEVEKSKSTSRGRTWSSRAGKGHNGAARGDNTRNVDEDIGRMEMLVKNLHHFAFGSSYEIWSDENEQVHYECRVGKCQAGYTTRQRLCNHQHTEHKIKCKLVPVLGSGPIGKKRVLTKLKFYTKEQVEWFAKLRQMRIELRGKQFERYNEEGANVNNNLEAWVRPIVRKEADKWIEKNPCPTLSNKRARMEHGPKGQEEVLEEQAETGAGESSAQWTREWKWSSKKEVVE